jgi:hypothetical protein
MRCAGAWTDSYTVAEEGREVTRYKPVTKVEASTVCRPVMEMATRQEDAQHVSAQTIDGQKVEAAELSGRLAKPTAVLVVPSGRTIPDALKAAPPSPE